MREKDMPRRRSQSLGRPLTAWFHSLVLPGRSVNGLPVPDDVYAALFSPRCWPYLLALVAQFRLVRVIAVPFELVLAWIFWLCAPMHRAKCLAVRDEVERIKTATEVGYRGGHVITSNVRTPAPNSRSCASQGGGGRCSPRAAGARADPVNPAG